MTVQELIAKLAELPATSTITVRVDCPHGGNSLPADIFKVFEVDPKWTDGKVGAVIVCDPQEGVEFEVQDAEESDEFEEGVVVPDFGKCQVCFDSLLNPCPACRAKYLSAGVEDNHAPHEEHDPSFGKCGGCGLWVTFPCYNCQVRELERGN